MHEARRSSPIFYQVAKEIRISVVAGEETRSPGIQNYVSRCVCQEIRVLLQERYE